jgi:hypothetical protein
MRLGHSEVVRVALATLIGLMATVSQLVPTAASEVSPAMTGVWDLTLRVDAANGSRDREINGSVALLSGEPLRTSWWPGLPNVSHVGTYSIDVESLGVVPVARRDIRIAGAAAQFPNRTIIVLNPGVDHGALVLEGTVVGDSITGSWRVTAYALGPSGRFTMRRAE